PEDRVELPVVVRKDVDPERRVARAPCGLAGLRIRDAVDHLDRVGRRHRVGLVPIAELVDQAIRAPLHLVRERTLLPQVLEPLANPLDHPVAIPAVAELHVADRTFRARLRERREVVLGEMHDEVLCERDHGSVDQPPALERELLRLRQRLAFDLRGELLELADAVLEHSEPVAQSRDAPAKARAAKEANDRVHRRERLLEARSLLHHALALLHEAGALLLDRIEPALALRELRFVQLRAFAPLALRLQLLGELLEPLRPDPPQVAKL